MYIYLLFGRFLILLSVSLIALSQKETRSSLKFREKPFSLEYQLSKRDLVKHTQNAEKSKIFQENIL